MVATIKTYNRTWSVQDEGPCETLITANVTRESVAGDWENEPITMTEIEVKQVELLTPDGTCFDIGAQLSDKALQLFADWVEADDVTEADLVN